MTIPQEIIIKTSPFVFIRRLIIIQFLWALAAGTISVQVDLTALYNASELPRYASFSLILTLVFTAVQILIIALAFLTWYVDTYRLNTEAVLHWHATAFGSQKLASTQHIAVIEVQQSALGRRLNYGTLALRLHNSERPARLYNLPNPHQLAAEVNKLIRPRPMDIEAHRHKSIPQLASEGEGQYLEFKSSFSWDYRRQSVNRDLNKAVMKNIAGFMNSTGGVILLGVDDEGELLGLEIEFQALPKPNVDGFENTFNTAFNNAIGPEYRHFAQVDFVQIDGKTVARILVLPAPEPVFLREKNTEEFYVRSGNRAQTLSISQAVKYIQTHFVE